MQNAAALGRGWPITRTEAEALRLTFNKRHPKVIR
ncbi:hypothetical protein QO001_006181 [Methylobacterium brachiatum]|jgi:hypothetical protein|uniref:Uncharacterized protein n=1 Tax=Methylobacterium brachiatum TaxID=269660 RepID=A0AAJ1TU30_9HYPH|nr:hypothetical protein [Methylobacterium brachiatum]